MSAFLIDGHVIILLKNFSDYMTEIILTETIDNVIAAFGNIEIAQ
ncbi:hypothetical protein S3E15_01825 [Bacillus mycoides]|uniref:Uncharacterized protein n=1 Tax=Bacillus mycoides TaxID=1405 RepID=A0AAP8BD00_BACMY|nr:hypothetical protein [Bacillus mycoides]MDR4904400.1 hypothetical protein [Bacillus mycoides]OSX90418.1 hypothetical protein S3E15_01825 [Bacillus mycoides]